MQEFIYEIRIAEYLDNTWSEWFNRWTIDHDDDGTTLLRGSVPDQPALYGMLARMSNLNLELLSLCRIDSESTEGGNEVSMKEVAS